MSKAAHPSKTLLQNCTCIVPIVCLTSCISYRIFLNSPIGLLVSLCGGARLRKSHLVVSESIGILFCERQQEMNDSSDDEPLAFRKSKLVNKENGEPLAACEEFPCSLCLLRCPGYITVCTSLQYLARSASRCGRSIVTSCTVCARASGSPLELATQLYAVLNISLFTHFCYTAVCSREHLLVCTLLLHSCMQS